MEMHTWNPEQIEKYKQGLAPEDRPIEAIRGTRRTYWDPRTKNEYTTEHGAVMGVGPGSSYNALEKAEKDRLDNATKIEEQGLRNQGHVEAARINADAHKYTAEISAKSGVKVPEQKWDIHIEEGTDADGKPTSKAWLYEEKSGRTKAFHGAEPTVQAGTLMALPREERNRIFSTLPKDQQKVLYELMKEFESKKKKEKGK
jgi:hypothetical protein